MLSCKHSFQRLKHFLLVLLVRGYQERLPFLSSENNSQVADPIRIVVSIQLVLLKDSAQTKSGGGAGCH